MDSQAWMTTMHTQRWSLSNFPIGIGLAAAAHVHMRNRIRSMADQQERGHLLRKSIITLDQVLATLEDLRDIDNAINMLDRAIEELEDRHWEARSDDQAKHSASRRRRRRHRQRVARERDQLAHAGSVANSVMTEVENGFRIELSPLPRFPEEGAFWTTESEDEYGSHQDAYRTPGHSQSETSRNRHAASESGAAQRSAPGIATYKL
ncbi:hypothetical protein DFQ27_003913 [Actinomortierella ambigua]|uniref:Uncharacterized protein n=1 Tax=Actinomortierella ambigua TaxID=1343610 RepID=A0A9P6Q521_9FUNG|nr:hypothetical protein DFQ27_003913 [Actinomortierella ambigua]